jgi:hypothetical protein
VASGVFFQNPMSFVSGTILKFTSNGNRLWSTCYGGGTLFEDLDIDKFGNIFITGFNQNNGTFQTYNPGGGAYFNDTAKGDKDIVILKFNNNGIRLWATLYGGHSYNIGYAIRADKLNGIVVAGTTRALDFPTLQQANAYFQPQKGSLDQKDDGFILHFNDSLQLKLATYIGGSEKDYIKSVDIDGNNIIYTTGFSASNNFPLPAQNPPNTYFQSNQGNFDSFVAAFNNDFQYVYGTYLGGVGVDDGNSISIDNSLNKLYVVGYTQSQTLFPCSTPAPTYFYQDTLQGTSDGFITRLSSSQIINTIYEKVIENNNFNIFPNPSTNEISIALHNIQDDYTLTIYNMLGQTIKSISNKNLNNKIITFQIDNFENGIYFVELITSKSRSSNKFIKQ